MTESSPQPHVTKAADQIKSFLSFSKIFSCNFLHWDNQRGKIRTVGGQFIQLNMKFWNWKEPFIPPKKTTLLFLWKKWFKFSSQRLLFKVLLCWYYYRTAEVRNISLAEWRLGQCVLLLSGGGGGPGGETERGAGGERGGGRLPGVRQTYQSDWDWFQETSQVFLQS